MIGRLVLRRCGELIGAEFDEVRECLDDDGVRYDSLVLAGKSVRVYQAVITAIELGCGAPRLGENDAEHEEGALRMRVVRLRDGRRDVLRQSRPVIGKITSNHDKQGRLELSLQYRRRGDEDM